MCRPVHILEVKLDRSRRCRQGLICVSCCAAGSWQQGADAAWAQAEDTASAPLVDHNAWQDADQGLGPLPCGIDDVSLSAAAAADRPDAWGLETWA